jgi:adenine phosphoribosyltransferase
LITRGGGVVSQALFIVDLPQLGGAAKLQARGIEVNSLIGFEGE